MRKLLAGLVGLLCLAAVGCTTNTNIAPVTFGTKATLQLAVGTINDASHTLDLQSGGSAGAVEYLNAVATFRNQFGNSAFGIGGATGSTAGFAGLSPIPGEVCNYSTGGGCNAGSTLFGFPVGLYGYGQFSAAGFCTTGVAGIAGCNGMQAAGPAWASPGAPTGLLIDLACSACPVFDYFPKGPDGTSYSLTDKIVINGSLQTYSASATLKNPSTLLAQAPAPAYAATAGTGGGTITFGAYPAGATEQVAVILSAVGLGSPVIAMAEVCTVATPTCSNTGLTATIPPGTLAVSGLPVSYTCFTVAADFPWVEAGPVTAPAVGTPTPVIVGANGNADLSASATGTCTQT